MNTVLHLARKDLTRHWIPALLVLVAIMIDVLDTRFGLAALSVRNFPDGFLGSIIKWPLSYLFVVAVVQEDRVIDPRAHWLTRPVPPLRLLGAKLLVNVLVVIAPMALGQSLLAHWVGAAPTMSLAIGAEVFAGAAVLVLVMMLFGALTRTILESCVFVGGLLLVWVLAALLSYGRSLNPAWWPRASDIDGGSRFVVVTATAIPVILVLLAYHYRRRSLALTSIASLVAAAAISVLAHQFPWRLLPPATSHARDTDAPVAAPALELAMKIAGPAMSNGVDIISDRKAGAKVQHRRVAVSVVGEKSRSDRLITKMHATTTLFFPDGSSKTYPSTWAYWDGLDLAPALRATLGYADPAAPQKFRRPLNLLALPPGDNPMPPQSPVRATTIVRYQEAHLEPFLRHPAMRSTSFISRSVYQTSAVAPAPDGSGVVVNLRRFNPISLLEPEGMPIPDPRLSAAVLHHAGRNEHAVGIFRRGSSDPVFGSVRFQRYSFTFSEVRNAEGHALGAPSDEWLSGAELVLYRTVPIAKHEQKLEFDNLSFAAETGGEVQMR